MTDPDLSSASEEGNKRANMNRKRKLTAVTSSSSSSSSSSSIQPREQDPIDLVDLAELFNIAEEHRPKLKSMDQLFKDNPHLSVPVGSKVPNCSAATGKLQSSTSSSSVHLHCAVEGCPSCDLPRFHVNATGTSRSSKDEKSLSAALLSPEEIAEAGSSSLLKCCPAPSLLFSAEVIMLPDKSVMSICTSDGAGSVY